MNRRGFISLLAGGAGAALVPWRGLIEPTIVLPPRLRGTVLTHQHVGRMVTVLRDTAARGPDGFSEWALAQAIYLGERAGGWKFLGGEWMTERDRQDFEAIASGRNQRYTGFADLHEYPPDIMTVVLHR